MAKIKRVFEQIEETIERDALQLSPGEFLPSEMQYSRTLAVSRLTVRKAVDGLVRSGLVQRIPGKGLMVAEAHAVPEQKKLLLSLPYVTCDAEFFITMMGCIDQANELHYSYKILAFTDVRERLERLKDEDLSAYCGAVVSCYESAEDQEMIRLFKEKKLPFIVMGDNESAPVVNCDDYNGGYVMGDYLIRHGHRDILFLTSDRPVPSVYRRTEGFRQALRDHDLPVREEYFLSVEDSGVPLLPQHADQRRLPPEAEPFLEGKIPFTALCGYHTLPILSMLNQLHRRGFRVPEDISVVAYGSEPYFAAQGVPLTAVMAPGKESGARAVEIMDQYLTGQIPELQSDMLPIQLKRQQSVIRLRRP